MRGEQWQRMISGQAFSALDAEIQQQKTQIRQLVAQFNRAPSRGNLKQVLAQCMSVGEHCFIEAGVHIDLGSQIRLGNRVYLNAHCVLLDGAELIIDDDVLIGPAVQLLTVTHPLDAQERASGWMVAKPIQVKQRAWIGAGAIILPGVTIGENAVVAAGSVVTRDVPDNHMVKGNPARSTPL